MMEKVEGLLAYLNQLDSIRDKPLSGNMMRTIDEKILMVCAAIEKEIGLPQCKSNTLDIPLAIDGQKIAEAVTRALHKGELIRPGFKC